MPNRPARRIKRQLLLAYVAAIATVAAVVAWVLPGQWKSVIIMSLSSVAAAWAILQIAMRQLRSGLHQLRETTDALGRGNRIEPRMAKASFNFSALHELEKFAGSVDRAADQFREMAIEQDRLRQRLGRSEKLAAIGELAAIVAHEVNNPLDGLQNSVHILRRRICKNSENGGDSTSGSASDSAITPSTDTDESTRKLLDMMDFGLVRIETTVRRLLNLSRDEPMRLSPVTIEEVVNDAAMFVEPRLHRYNIRLIRDFPPMPIVVYADAVHLAQAMINLMMNAADAMKSTGGTLTLRCQLGEGMQTPQAALLEVIDTGTGIREQDLPRIFDPFYSTKGQGKGTGLGLAVVARVIEAHHGRIDVQTKWDQGTCFRLELPAVVTAAVAAATPSTVANAATTNSHALTTLP